MSFHRLIRMATVIVAAAFAAGGAQAQLFRAYLSTTGNDANPCTLVAPCRLLPAALGAVASNGEIWMLDSGNFNVGTVAINKSVSILAVPGAVGSVVTNGATAISIIAPANRVSLRNIVITPIAGTSAAMGISMTGGTFLNLERVLVSGMGSHGVSIAAEAEVRISDSIIRDTGGTGLLVINGARAAVTRSLFAGAAMDGIAVGAGALGTAELAVTDSSFIGSTVGINASPGGPDATVKLMVQNSQFFVNDSGIVASGATSTVTGSVQGCSFASNLTGISANAAGASLLLVGNVFSGNTTGVSNTGALVQTSGNQARGNGTDTSGAMTPSTSF